MWVTSGSYVDHHPDYFVGQWVKWVNRCDPLSTLLPNNLYNNIDIMPATLSLT